MAAASTIEKALQEGLESFSDKLGSTRCVLLMGYDHGMITRCVIFM